MFTFDKIMATAEVLVLRCNFLSLGLGLAPLSLGLVVEQLSLDNITGCGLLAPRGPM